MSSMFSSMQVTSCSAGVSPAMTGRASTGMFDFLFSNGRPWFNPQNEVGNRGLIKQIRAMDDSLNEVPSTGRSDGGRGRIRRDERLGSHGPQPIVEIISTNTAQHFGFVENIEFFV